MPIENGLLATWDTSSLSGSTYTLRLTVKDVAGNNAVRSAVVRLITLSNLQASDAYLSPNGDSANDTTVLSGDITLAADWTVTVRDAGQAPVKTFHGSGSSVDVLWDATHETGTVVPCRPAVCDSESTATKAV